MRNSGMTPRALAAELQKQGIPSPHNGAWTASQVKGSLDAPLGWRKLPRCHSA